MEGFFFFTQRLALTTVYGRRLFPNPEFGLQSPTEIIWAIKNTPIPSHYTSWLIGFPILWVIIIPSKPGSISPYSNQLTRVFLMAHLKPPRTHSTAGRLLAAQRLPTATADVAAQRGQLAQEAEDQGGFARAHRTWRQDIKIGDFG